LGQNPFSLQRTAFLGLLTGALEADVRIATQTHATCAASNHESEQPVPSKAMNALLNYQIKATAVAVRAYASGSALDIGELVSQRCHLSALVLYNKSVCKRL
jgi:hypothetical protein